MSRVHGKKGQLYVGLASDTAVATPVTFLNEWSVDFATDKAEVTSFSDSNKVYVSGLSDASGSFGGFYDDATAQLYTAAQDGLARRFYLYPTNADTGDYWYGTALFDFSVSGAVGDAVSISGAWAAASAVTQVKS